MSEPRQGGSPPSDAPVSSRPASVPQPATGDHEAAPAYPLWSALVLALDVVVIYAITVHGAPAGLHADFTELDRHITRALAALRRARVATVRSGSRDAVDTEERAEANLNALLEYRFTRQH
jgi:hypothetical protein